MLAAAAEHFTPVYVEKDDDVGLVEAHGVDYYPAFVFLDAQGEEVWRTGQPLDADELLEDLTLAVESLQEPALGDN